MKSNKKSGILIISMVIYGFVVFPLVLLSLVVQAVSKGLILILESSFDSLMELVEKDN